MWAAFMKFKGLSICHPEYDKTCKSTHVNTIFATKKHYCHNVSDKIQINPVQGIAHYDDFFKLHDVTLKFCYVNQCSLFQSLFLPFSWLKIPHKTCTANAGSPMPTPDTIFEVFKRLTIVRQMLFYISLFKQQSCTSYVDLQLHCRYNSQGMFFQGGFEKHFWGFSF